MIDFAITALVVGIFALITMGIASRLGRAMAPWVWLAFAEYFICAIIQYYFGVDATGYRRNGVELARLLDLRFEGTAGELWALLFHQPSAFDGVVTGAGTNTASMSAVAGWFTFLVRGSTYAAQALMAGLSMVSAFALFDVLKDECPTASQQRIFAGIVVFPSIAFWTAAFHKESFCLIGTALAACAWRAARKRQLRAILYGCVGVTVLALFRAPALPPLFLGLVLYHVVDRVRKASGTDVALVGPVYMVIGVALVGAGMVGLTRISPNLGIDNLGETIAHQQNAWSLVEGGSTFETDAPVERSLGMQLATAPLGLLNALLRPQLFDVRNPLMLISALEMTFIAMVLLRILKFHGAGGLVRRIQSSPILVLCAVVTLVGFTFVGLTTRNFGSLARYRVSFMPFYGCLLAILAPRSPETRQAPTSRANVNLPSRVRAPAHSARVGKAIKAHKR